MIASDESTKTREKNYRYVRANGPKKREIAVCRERLAVLLASKDGVHFMTIFFAFLEFVSTLSTFFGTKKVSAQETTPLSWNAVIAERLVWFCFLLKTW